MFLQLVCETFNWEMISVAKDGEPLPLNYISTYISFVFPHIDSDLEDNYLFVFLFCRSLLLRVLYSFVACNRTLGGQNGAGSF